MSTADFHFLVGFKD